jgi:hypothetical protein
MAGYLQAKRLLTATKDSFRNGLLVRPNLDLLVAFCAIGNA